MPRILANLLRLDARSDEEVARDVEDEFAFHIGESEREFAGQGMQQDDASRAARERFGDAARYRRECERIARKERIVLQKINFVLMLIILIVVIVAAVQMIITQRYNTLAIQAINSQLVDMKMQREAEERSESRHVGVVYIGGSIKRPGVYQLPSAGRLTLAQLVTAAGGGVDIGPDSTITITRGEEGSITRKTFPAHSAAAGDESFFLQPNDHVFLQGQPLSDDDRAALEAQLRDERAKTKAVTDFLMQTLTAADPNEEARILTLEDVFDQAQSRIESGEIDNPEVETRLREAIEKARGEQGEDHED